MLNIFENDAFSTASMTEAINIVPFVPKRIGAMGLFTQKFPRVNIVYLERKGNIISLLPTKPRGSGETTKRPRGQRDIIPVMIPHIPYDDTVLASAIAGVREFETEEQLRTISDELNEVLGGLRQDHEVTHEFFRIGAIKGIILDGDGTTELLDLFDSFDITQIVHDFDFSGTPNVKGECIDIIREIEEVLGGESYSYIHAFVGNTFWDELTQVDEVATAYNEQTSHRYSIDTQGQGTPGRGTSQLMFGDILFENYRGKVGAVPFIGPGDAHFFPMGVSNLFVEYFGPMEDIENVNKPGRTVFAKQKNMKWDEGIEVHSESNPIMLCRRPKLLIKGTNT